MKTTGWGQNLPPRSRFIETLAQHVLMGTILMRPLVAGALLVGATFTDIAGAQSVVGPTVDVTRGIEAYGRGDFETAITILKPLVYDFETFEPAGYPNPRASFYLARMAERGEGMAVDSPLACALLYYANLGFLSRNQYSNLAMSARAEADACDRVSDAKEVLALKTFGFLDGITSTQWAIDGDRWVVLDRTGFHVYWRGEEHGIEWAPGIVATRHLRHTEVRFANGKERHFVELFSWQTSKSDGHLLRELIWSPFEIIGTAVAVAGLGTGRRETVLTELDSPYPMANVPSDVLDRIVLTPNDDTGEVEWTIRVGSPRGGVIKSQLLH